MTAIGLWTLAMGATGAATTFLMLIGARVFLGAVTAAARPALISITGDVFPTGVRGRALGLIDSGELVGDGVGFFLAGTIAAVLSWRGVFWVLGGLGVGLVYLVWRLPEPPRTGGDAHEIGGEAEDDIAVQTAEEADDVHADRRLVLRGDQTRLPFRRAVRYVLRVRTQVLVMVAIAVGSFFFAGIRTFAIVFVVGAYGVDRSVADVVLLVAGLGAVVGIVAGGRIGDALITADRRRGGGAAPLRRARRPPRRRWDGRTPLDVPDHAADPRRGRGHPPGCAPVLPAGALRRGRVDELSREGSARAERRAVRYSAGWRSGRRRCR